MNGSAAVRNFVVGLVFLGSLALVGVVTLQVTGLSLGGRPMRVEVRFDHVRGLRPGDEVRYRGYGVGQVEKIQPEFEMPGGAADPLPIRVLVRLDRELPLPADSSFLVKSRGPLGGNYLEIVAGTGPRAQGSPPRFAGSASPEMFDEIGEMVRENRQTLREAIQEIRDSVRAINEREGAIGALIKDPLLRDRVAAAIDNIETVTRTIREGKGTVGKLINESKLHDDLEDLLARARRVMTDAEEGKGPLGALLKDEELARDLREGVADLRETIAKVNQGEGTVGQLVNNREAWDRLVFVLRQVQEAVEDFREQAPINTFVNAVFSAF